MSDREVTRKIENFIPQCQPRRSISFHSIEEALAWAAEKLLALRGGETKQKSEKEAA